MGGQFIDSSRGLRPRRDAGRLDQVRREAAAARERRRRASKRGSRDSGVALLFWAYCDVSPQPTRCRVPSLPARAQDAHAHAPLEVPAQRPLERRRPGQAALPGRPGHAGDLQRHPRKRLGRRARGGDARRGTGQGGRGRAVPSRPGLVGLARPLPFLAVRGEFRVRAVRAQVLHHGLLGRQVLWLQGPHARRGLSRVHVLRRDVGRGDAGRGDDAVPQHLAGVVQSAAAGLLLDAIAPQLSRISGLLAGHCETCGRGVRREVDANALQPRCQLPLLVSRVLLRRTSGEGRSYRGVQV
mmetsp:Transcript_142300/g.354595  ORF Transcript_142300/g.354595 Transcript_142300/m.354595 type:complete len:298 (-) Transcript_142300:588-1481(-)